MKRLLTFLLALLTTACFDVREEITVAADGSGHLSFDYAIPREALRLVGGEAGIREEIDKLVGGDPRLRLKTLEVTTAGRDSRIRIELTADSMLALMDLQESEAFQNLPASSRQLAGTTEVKLDGLSVQVGRRIDTAGALGLAAFAIGREERRSRQLEYIIHLPKPATDHNADRTENGGRTLIWQRSLGEALKNPVETRFTAPIPIPVWALSAAVLLLMLMVLGAISLVRRLRKRRTMGETVAP